MKNDDFDYFARYITLSVVEWKFLNKHPERFEVYIVYGLNEKKDPNYPDWYPPYVVKIKGSELKGRDTNQPSIRVKTLKPFWSDKGKRQVPVPKTIFNNVKKKIKKN